MAATKLSYTVRFLCPAFLGNAEQSGQWRTPPFKALLRQWWRIAYAADHEFNVDVGAMRQAEASLFGAAADRESNRSGVRIRLDCWEQGRLKTWEPLPRVTHPEVGSGIPVGSDLYLGYGPLNYDKVNKATVLKANAAIQAGERATMHIVLTGKVPKEDSDRISKAIGLINLYGTVGGRSRNGWGSFSLEPQDGSPAPSTLDPTTLRSWRMALALDWPHAIGREKSDGPSLIWQTEVLPNWRPAMERLAELKIRLRTQFIFPADDPPHPRHWLSYPVTNHPVRAWDSHQPPLRLPNSLRFKLRPENPGSTRVCGVIFHIPCLPPGDFAPNRAAIQRVWEAVHAFLDRRELRLSRLAA